MDNFDEQNSTEQHDYELDKIFNDVTFNLDDEKYANRDLVKDTKTLIRFARKKIKTVLRERGKKNFTGILYVTLDFPLFTPNSIRRDSPQEYISHMQKQYPDKDIRALIPIIGIKEDTKISKKIIVEVGGKQMAAERTPLKFNFYLQNRKQEAVIYKFVKTSENVQVYGIYCAGFSGVNDISEMSKINRLGVFMKAVRIAVSKFKKAGFVPDAVHCEFVPYYLGYEFETPMPQQVKIFQVVKDFTQIDMVKPELFWAAINLADENTIRRICREEVVKKCFAKLFNARQTGIVLRTGECLNSIFDNYHRFRKYVDQGESLDENMIFNRLNKAIAEMFPQYTDNGMYYNQMAASIKYADSWAVVSETYYREIFETPKITGGIYSLLEENRDKGTFIPYGCDLSVCDRSDEQDIYQTFNSENFRDMRGKNKKTLIKEFNSDRIKTNFQDSFLFTDQNHKVFGSLDSFYDAPLLFANMNTDIFANGVDILFNTVLKLFELHKNFQVIISIKGGLDNNFIRHRVKFLLDNKYFNGKWVFIDGEVNLFRFLAASDMFLIPRRVNIASPEHFYAMYYGCVPVVSRSGILNDTVIDIFDDMTYGCGFKTKKSMLTEDDNPEIFLTPLLKALNIYQNNPSSWNLLTKNCLNNDSGWNFKVLEKYNEIYNKLIEPESELKTGTELEADTIQDLL